MSTPTTQPGQHRLRIEAEIDLDVVDLDALTRAALHSATANPAETDEDQAEILADISADPQAAICELFMIDDTIDSIPGIRWLPYIVTVGPVDTGEPRPQTEDKTDVTLGPVTMSDYAPHVTGIPPEYLGYDNTLPTEDERAYFRNIATTLAGTLWHASIIVTDHLFDDITEIHQVTRAHGPGSPATRIVPYLPERYRSQYNAPFVKALTATFLDVTSRLVRGWQPPASIAEEFALMFLLDQVEVTADTFQLDLPEEWREELEENLGQGEQHLNLLGDDPPEQDVRSWFTPYDGTATPIPYAAAE